MKILPMSTPHTGGVGTNYSTDINNNLLVESNSSEELKGSMESVVISAWEQPINKKKDSSKSLEVTVNGQIESQTNIESSVGSAPNNKERRVTCSLRVFIVLSLVSLILVCSISIYLAVFLAMYQSMESLTKNVFDLLEEKITLHLDSLLKDMMITGITTAQNHNEGLVPVDAYRRYLMTPYNVSRFAVGYEFEDTEERYMYSFVGKRSEMLSFTYRPKNFHGIIQDLYDSDGNLLKANDSIGYSAFNVSSMFYYNYTINESNRMNKEGAFSKPYTVVNGSLSISYCTKLYDSTLYSQGIKKTRGISNTVLPLSRLSIFLKENVKVFEHGYVIIKEHDSFYMIAGNINTTSGDESSRLNIFDLTDRSAGDVILQINNTMKTIQHIPETILVNSMGRYYMVKYFHYQYENLEWDIYMVVVTSDILRNVHIAVGTSFGVAFIIMIISIIFSIFLSFVFLKPITYLRKQFGLIKVMQLEKVHKNNSIFDELDQVYSSLELTVKWLKEIRSFVPESVFYQLRKTFSSSVASNPTVGIDSVVLGKLKSQSSLVSTNSGAHDWNSVQAHKTRSLAKHNSSTIFKIGLQPKECSVIHIRLNDLLISNSPQTVALMFPKILTLIAESSKIYQSDYQILSVEQFRIIIEPRKRKSKLIAQEIALKIKRGLDQVNQQFFEEFETSIKYSIGISTRTNSFVGNLGTKQHRCYCIISNSCFIAERLSFLAYHNGVDILVDQQTIAEQFVSRPIDRIQSINCVYSTNTAEINYENVYEIIRESIVEVNGKYISYKLLKCGIYRMDV